MIEGYANKQKVLPSKKKWIGKLGFTNICMILGRKDGNWEKRAQWDREDTLHLNKKNTAERSKMGSSLQREQNE